MPCSIGQAIDQVAASNRRSIQTYCAIYPLVFVIAVGVIIYLHFHPLNDNPLTDLGGHLISLIAVPLVPQHIARAQSLRMLKLLRVRCADYQSTHPECEKIAEMVNKIIMSRAGA
jgi:hypothetical protein